MSTDKKIEILLDALRLVATSSTDLLASVYCATILREVGEADLLKSNTGKKRDISLD